MRLKLVALVLALQTVWLLSTVVREESTLHGGQVVLLETHPIDPRDPLRGDYVNLSYQISDVPLKLFSPGIQVIPGQGTTVYIGLAASGTNQFWRVTRASLDCFEPSPGEVLLRGESSPNWRSGEGMVHVLYGIESFYVAEGTGNSRGKLTALVAVSKSGRGVLKDVLVNGRPYSQIVKAGQ